MVEYRECSQGSPPKEGQFAKQGIAFQGTKKSRTAGNADIYVLQITLGHIDSPGQLMKTQTHHYADKGEDRQ
jgi:hypothetical protein